MAAKKPTFTVTVDESLVELLEGLVQALKENTASHSGTSLVLPQVTEQEQPVQETQQPTLPVLPLPTMPQEYAEVPMQTFTAQPPVQAQPVQMPVMQMPGAQVQPMQMPVAQAQPVQMPVMQMPVQTQPVQQVAQTVPTSQPSYTIEQIMSACAQLMDAGQPVLGLIQQKYGANAITEIDPANYGILATDLRQMGARI